MKNLKRIILTILFAIAFIILLQVNAQAASYKIENMDIQATVLNNGDVRIKQSITYDFNGSYNGIYITVPYIIDDSEHDEIITNNRINDNLYTGSGVSVNGIADSKNIKYSQTDYARNGNSGLYTIQKNDGVYELKVYSPSQDETKTFILNYTIENLCVKHNDIGELYYNFIGGEWDVDINNLNIDIYLPSNRDDVYIWGHGPLNGVSTIVSNSHANFKVDTVRKGQYVAARVIFDNSNIMNSSKTSRINAQDIIFQDEQEIGQNKEEKNKFTQRMIIFASILAVYWVVLLLIFEKEKKHEVYELNEDELLKKYNPMIAGCIQGNRDVLARDIIAVLLNLIDKGNIKLDVVPNTSRVKEQYTYKISKNPEKEAEMDEIEKFIYNWIFVKGDENVNLQGRLEELPKEKTARENFKNLSKYVKNKTNELGANKAKVPVPLRVLNVGILIIAILEVIRHIMFNGFDVYTSNSSLLAMLVGGMIYILPLVIMLAYIPISILIILRHRVNNLLQKVTGKKIVTTTVTILVIFAIIIILTAIFSPIKYIIVDEILICIALIIVLTDNLMLKNNDEIMDDYVKLNLLKDKIENYTLLEEKDIEQIKIWDKYLAYAVSFGIC